MPKAGSLAIGQVQESLDHVGIASFIYCHRKTIEITEGGPLDLCL